MNFNKLKFDLDKSKFDLKELKMRFKCYFWDLFFCRFTWRPNEG